MLRLLTDEDFNNDILRGVLRQRPDLDIVRVQDVGLRSRQDALVLEWASAERRVVLTHDVNTMTREAYDRLRAGLPMSGLLVVSHALSIGQAVAEVLLVAEGSREGERENQVLYLPL